MSLPIELRPFDGEDWFAYAGCESENPLIAYCKDFTLVLDDDIVEVYRSCRGEPDVGSGYNLTWEFPDHGTAMLFALSVRGAEPDGILDLKAQAAAGKLISHAA